MCAFLASMLLKFIKKSRTYYSDIFLVYAVVTAIMGAFQDWRLCSRAQDIINEYWTTANAEISLYVCHASPFSMQINQLRRYITRYTFHTFIVHSYT